MDEDTRQTNLNTLKEMIFDEHKLVTYVSLSKELCIHVNDSKLLLSKMIEDITKNDPDLELNVIYIISGLSGDSKARTTVSSQTDIEGLRKTFKCVFFEHVYSVSKGQPLVDKVAFLAANKFEDLPLCTGLIKNNSCVKRTSDEIGNLKSNSQESVESEQQKPSNLPLKKTKNESVIIDNTNGESKTVTKVYETKSEPTIKKETPSPKKDLSNVSKQIKKNGNKTQKGIAGFFNKCNSAPGIKSVPETDKEKKATVVKVEKAAVKPETKVEKMNVDEDIEVDVEKEIVEVAVKKEKVKAAIKKEVNKKPKSKSTSEVKKNAKVDKKRKRVLHISDSESEEDKDPFQDDPVVNHESEDEIPPTPTVNTVKITSGLVNPRKKRKVIDKTYTDEDGFILTKKEVVFESGSDDEKVNAKENVEIQQKNEVKHETSPKEKKKLVKNSKKKISLSQNGKQATLMNFFKKA